MVTDMQSVRLMTVQSGILKKSADKVETALERLKNMRIQTYKNSYETVRHQVDSHIAKCHSLLDALGQKVTVQLMKENEKLKVEISDRNKNIEKMMSKCEILLECAELLKKNESESELRIDKFLKEVEYIKSVGLEFNQSQVTTNTIDIDDSIFEVIDNHMKVDVGISDKKRLPCLVETPLVSADHDESGAFAEVLT